MTTSRSPRYCLQCDDGTRLAHRTLDMTARIGQLSEVVPAVAGWHCPVCAECEFDRGEGERFSVALARVRERVTDERAATTRSTRKKRGLNQAQAPQRQTSSGIALLPRRGVMVISDQVYRLLDEDAA